jgi:capsular polysaccharide biosynthesis protein
LPELKASYEQETIETFKLSKVVTVKEKEYVKAKELFLPDYTASPGNFNPEVIRGLSKHLITSLVDEKAANGSRKIFISRSKAPRRKIRNEEALETILIRYGYEVLCMEDFSFKEQVQITYNSQVMISLHGAGLTNMMFMPFGSSVFELRFKGDDHSNCYFSMAAAYEHQYFYQLCEPVDQNIATHSGDVIVGLDEFENILKLIEDNSKEA